MAPVKGGATLKLLPIRKQIAVSQITLSPPGNAAPDEAGSLTRAYIALASVCFFWGTTYLGIRMALEGFAPTVLISLRFLLSGGLLLVFLLLRGYRLPPWPELWRTALTGVIIIGGGNGFLTYAEQIIPSGLAAIFITLAPFWFVGLDALLPEGPRLHKPTLLAMGIGLVGAIVLAMPRENDPVPTANVLLARLSQFRASKGDKCHRISRGRA